MTLASTLLHRLDTQCVQQNIKYVQQNMKMRLGQTSEQTFHIMKLCNSTGAKYQAKEHQHNYS